MQHSSISGMDLDTPTSTPATFSPLTIIFPSNSSWTIYGRNGSLIYAQPHFITYPLFVPIYIQGDVLVYIHIDGIPDGFIKDSSLVTSKFYKNVLRILTNIALDESFDFAGEYIPLPFNNCRIVIGWDSIDPKIRKLTALTEWCCDWETQTRSLVVLRNFWGLDPAQMPPVLKLEDVVLRAWLHDTVALVAVRGEPEMLYALKTNRNICSLYHEIRTLLKLPPHPNIVERPVYLITKETAFSLFHPFDLASPYCSELTYPIIAFLTPFYQSGTLKSYMQHNPTPPLTTQAKWARQLTSALLHVFTHGGIAGKPGMHTALKMDNIVLDAAGDLRLIDFELAGTWIQYTPPEVLNAKPARKPFTHSTGPKYRLGTRPPLGMPCSVCAPHPCIVPEDARGAECYRLHQEVFSWRFSNANILDPGRVNSELGIEEQKVRGFWGHANGAEVERAMVWMLSCCLWCVFEGRGCLSELGPEWFPVAAPVWRKARGRVPGGVLEIVGKGLEERRPRLVEMLRALEEWEKGLGEESVEDELGEESVEDELEVDLGDCEADAGFGNGKRLFGEEVDGAGRKKRRVGSGALEPFPDPGCDMAMTLALSQVSMIDLTEYSD